MIEDGALVLAESGAILEYLAEKFGAGRFVPAMQTEVHTRYLHWMHFAEGSAMPLLVLELYLTRVTQAPAAVLDRINGQIAAQLDYLDSALADAAYFAGDDLSVADIQMSFPAIAATSRGGLTDGRPNVWRWLGEIRQRPAFARANPRGGELQLP